MISDYSFNSRNLNRFPEAPNFTTELPDWKIKSIRGLSSKSYYHPIPDDDMVFRKRALPFNENAKVIQFQNWHVARDPFYERRSWNLVNERPGETISEDRMPQNIVARNVQRPLGVVKSYPLTREEKTGLKDPDWFNLNAAPRQRKLQVINSQKYVRENKVRKPTEIKIDYINTGSTYLHPVMRNKSLGSVTPKDRIKPNYSEGQYYRGHPRFDLHNPFLKRTNAPTDVRDRGTIDPNYYTIRGVPSNFYKIRGREPQMHREKPLQDLLINTRGPSGVNIPFRNIMTPSEPVSAVDVMRMKETENRVPRNLCPGLSFGERVNGRCGAWARERL